MTCTRLFGIFPSMVVNFPEKISYSSYHRTMDAWLSIVAQRRLQATKLVVVNTDVSLAKAILNHVSTYRRHAPRYVSACSIPRLDAIDATVNCKGAGGYCCVCQVEIPKLTGSVRTLHSLRISPYGWNTRYTVLYTWLARSYVV